jgi:hypothetical protein
MFVDYQLAGLSALEAHYAGVKGRVNARPPAIALRGEKAR